MIEKRQVTITPYKLKRTLHIYLPNSYHSSQKKYPVMYMYDGHNLFNDEDATYGTSWGLKDFLDGFEKEIIIVGIECNHEGNKRLDEFCPYQVEDTYLNIGINGTGDQFMEWVVNELKPFIDKKYRTKTSRLNTAIGGSSMGGLMSFYTILKYNKVFSKAACLSPAFPICRDELQAEFKNFKINKNTKIYLDFGSEESSKKGLALMMDDFLTFNHEATKQGASCYPRIIFKGKHNEETWSHSLPTIFNYLYVER